MRGAAERVDAALPTRVVLPEYTERFVAAERLEAALPVVPRTLYKSLAFVMVRVDVGEV